MGYRNCFMEGPAARMAGAVIAGPCVTLQMMPKREDLFEEGEYADVEKQLHRHVLYQVEEAILSSSMPAATCPPAFSAT